MIARGVEMAELALADGMEAAIARFHASEPGSRSAGRRERRERAAERAAAEDDGDGTPRTEGETA